MKDLCASVCVFIFIFIFSSCMRSVWVWNDVCSIPDEDYWDKQSFKYYILKALYPSNFLHSLPPVPICVVNETLPHLIHGILPSHFILSLYFSLFPSPLHFFPNKLYLTTALLSPPSFLSAKFVSRQRLT